jgi:hypothetical protein
VPAPELLERLRRLERLAREQSIKAEPKRGVYFPRWLSPTEARFIDLWRAKQLSKTEQEELYALLAEGSMVDLTAKAPACELKQWAARELSLVIAFDKYSRLYPEIIVPSLINLLKPYLLNTVARLFEKYGWKVGQPDCSSILPLEEWAPEDHRTIIGLYQY